jgi:hypothetical protein
LRDDLGMLEDHLRDESAGLKIPAPLELEYVPLGADHRPLIEAFRERVRRPLRCGWSHGDVPGVKAQLSHLGRSPTSRQATPIVAGATPGRHPAGVRLPGPRAVRVFPAAPPKSAMDQPGSYL